MCKRFIEDLSNKIIEKLELNDYTPKRLRQIMEECKTILEKRQEDIITQLEKVYHVENYFIEKGYKYSITIGIRNSSRRQFILYYNRPDNTIHEAWDRYHLENHGPYRCYYACETISFSTKEELLNHLIFIIPEIEDKQTFYNICLKKINLIQDLADNY